MTDLNDLLRELANDIARLDETREWSEGTIPELALRLDLLLTMSRTIKNALDELNDHIGKSMDGTEMTIPEIGTLTRKNRYSSSWADDDARERMYDDAIHAIIRKTCIDPNTGEIHGNLANVAREVFRLMSEAFSLGADPKVAFRKVLNLQPDTYRSKYVSGYSLTINREENNETAE